MKKEELILKKISGLEAQLEPLIAANKKTQELKADIIPLLNKAMAILIDELLEVEAGFELNDLFELIKQLMRSTRNFTHTLKLLDKVLDFMKDMEPLLKSSVPQLIGYLDQLEKKGVLRMYKAALDIRAKIAAAYSPEDIEQMGDGLVAMMGFAKKLTDPKTIEVLDKLLEIPAQLDLKKIKRVGPLGMFLAGFSKEIHDGNGVIVELTKALGKMRAA